MLKRNLAVAILAASTSTLSLSAMAQELVDSTNLRNAVTIDAIRGHLRELQRVANRNGGTRASGTPGYGASADYVVSQLPAGAYSVTRQVFEFPFFEELSDASLVQVTPVATEYTLGSDFLSMEYSGSAPGGVTGPLVEVDLALPPVGPDNTSTSGCDTADFAGFPAGGIALVQRGTCSFGVKAVNAEAAGAAGVIIFNEGQPGRTDLLNGTLGGPIVDIPVVGATFALGNALAAATDPVTVSLRTETVSENRVTENVLAETRTGRAGRVVVVGAHLDSVPEGPGINDNGSGSAAILEIARQLANTPVRNKVRFAWWGAEESGLLGAEYYVGQLSPRELGRISANLNFDMLGSPNYVRFVYDGDGSATPDAGPDGSGLIEQIFLQYFGFLGLATEPTAFDGRSDYGPFIDAGIPAGGLFSGAEEIKTVEQAQVYGGTAGIAYDPCYHQACDDIRNVNRRGLDELSDAAAHAVLTLAQRRQPLTATVATAGLRAAESQREFKGHRQQR